MRDLILQCAGVAGIAVALIHGALGETKVFAKATIQCRALSDPSEGAAISSTPPPIHATVPACQTRRIRVRKLSGWMVALANTLVSPNTP